MLFVAAVAAAHCAPVHLAVAKRMPSAFSAKLVERTSKNFEIAYSKACTDGYLKKPLISPSVKDKHLFLSNAPNANVALIYLSKGRVLLEYSFVSEAGKTQVPSLEQLLEAIYCAAHGASSREQEESGRCLPD